ncbi:MAG TPA: AAA family ATPase [Methanocorpusculum sp.]|nr:AAA family ATPase [Methanocorpusculum sp.]
MLWIEKYRPKTFDEIIGQESAVRHLKAYSACANLPHLMIIGRSGCGKSTCLEAFAREFYSDSVTENTTIFPVSIMFSQGNTYFAENDRFSSLYQKNKSVLSNFKYIVKWHASLKPLSAAFRLIIFDGASELPKDAQAALRRIMEQYSRTCRFVFVTNSMSSLIDPIRSRCVPLYLFPITKDLMREYLWNILTLEGMSTIISKEKLEMLILSAEGDLRRALVWLELIALHGFTDLMELAYTETGKLACAAVEACWRGDEAKARKISENLMIEYGLSGQMVLCLLHEALRSNMTPDIALLLSNADLAVRTGSNEYLQMNAFISLLCGEMRRS